MRKYWKLGLAVLLLSSLVLICFSREKPPAFVPMEIKGVSIDPVGQSPVVILVDKEETRMLPIWIGLLEANAIDKEINATPTARPLTHDLLHAILSKMHIEVKEVRIVELKENIYYARIFLRSDKETVEIDARPSDAIALALKSKAPVFVASRILAEQGVALTKKEARGERFGIRIQELTPDLAAHFDFKEKGGVLVSEVLPGTSGESAGMKAGDIITKIDSRRIGTVVEFEKVFDELQSATSARIQVFRDGEPREIILLLGP